MVDIYANILTAIKPGKRFYSDLLFTTSSFIRAMIKASGIVAPHQELQCTPRPPGQLLHDIDSFPDQTPESA